jgi:hypothetical protein
MEDGGRQQTFQGGFLCNGRMSQFDFRKRQAAGGDLA